MDKINYTELSLASDDECKIIKEQLIQKNIIKLASNNDTVIRQDGTLIVTTFKESRQKRNKLIDDGIIITKIEYIKSKIEPSNLEEGEYIPRKINCEDDYLRRKNNYFWFIKDILQTRKDLRLIIDKKTDRDPTWYF